MKKSDAPIIVEQIYNISLIKVWKAITELDQMKKWYFDNIPAFKPEIGFETNFNVISGERTFPHYWKVLEVIPNKKIAYNWSYKIYPGNADVHFELFPEGNSTKLVLTLIVNADFPDDIPEFKRESCIGGWDYYLKGQLKEYLHNLD